MNSLQDQHVLILGLGDSGLAMARWCAAAGARVSVADTREEPPHLATLRSELFTAAGTAVANTVEEWTANGPDSALPDAWYDEFVLRGGAPAQAGPIWFRVLQTCDRASQDWAEIPASGTSTKGLKAPAALLEVISSEQVVHEH